MLLPMTAATAMRAAAAAARPRSRRLAARGRALRTALCGSLADYGRRHADGLRTTRVAGRGRRVWTVSRVAGLRISRSRRIRTAGTRLAKALPSAAASIRSITACTPIGSGCLGWFILRPPAAGRSAASLRRGRSRTAGTSPGAAGGAARCTMRHGRRRRLPAELLHGPLLLGEGNPLHRRCSAAAEEVSVLRTAWTAGHRAVRVPETRGAGRHRQLAAHQTRLANLRSGSP